MPFFSQILDFFLLKSLEDLDVQPVFDGWVNLKGEHSTLFSRKIQKRILFTTKSKKYILDCLFM